MLAHAAAGNRASALLAYERCRGRLAADLGIAPSSALQALHLDLLRTP
jgi:DNA-binding SARP family transcriptional activator